MARLKVWRILDPGKPWHGDTVRGEDWQEASDAADAHIAEYEYTEDYELEEVHDPED